MLEKLRKQLSKKRVTLAWLFSYTAIIIVPFCLCLFCVNRYSADIEKQTKQLNEYISYTITDNVKETLTGMKKLYQQLYFDKNIKALGSVTQYEDYFRRTEYYTVLEQLQINRNYSSNIDIFFVYYRNTDCILSAEGLLKSRDYYNLYFSDCPIDYESWLREIQISKKFKKFDVHNRKLHNDIMYSDTVNGGDTFILICSRTDDFFDGIVEDMLADYSVYILDSDKNIINYISGNNDNILYDKLTDKSSDEKYEVTENIVRLDTDTMSVVTSMPEKILFKHLNNLKLITTILFIVSIIISILQIVWFLRKNYKPIEDILKKMHISGTVDDNEFALIGSTIESIMSDRKRLDNLYVDQLEKMRRLSLEKIVRNGYVDYTTQRGMSEYNISFEGVSFLLEVFAPDNEEDLFKNSDITELEKRKELYFIIQNVIEELLSINEIDCYLTDIDDKIVCLLCFQGECTEEERQDIDERTAKGFKFIADQFNVKTSYSISEVFYSIGNVPQIYIDIVHELDSRQLYDVKCGGDISADKRALIDSVKKKDLISAKRIMNGIFRRLEKNKVNDKSVKEIAEEIFTAVITTSGIIGTETEADLSGLKKCEDIEAIKRYSEKIISVLCSGSSAAVHTKMGSLCRMIEQYINEHYSDVNLNISNIAEYFNMSPTYLSGQFKEYTGKKITDYINDVRLENAKKIMGEGRYTIAIIAKMVGFGHVRTFNRIFKQYEGVTPSEYIKNNF